jgi:hypothetical protein
MIDERDEGNALAAVANQRSTSGSSGLPCLPERRFGGLASGTRPPRAEETGLPRCFMEWLFDVTHSVGNAMSPEMLSCTLTQVNKCRAARWQYQIVPERLAIGVFLMRQGVGPIHDDRTM